MSRTHKDRPYDLGKMENNAAVVWSVGPAPDNPMLFGKEADKALAENFKSEKSRVWVDNNPIFFRGENAHTNFIHRRQIKSRRTNERMLCNNLIKQFNSDDIDDYDDFIREDYANDSVWYL